MKKSPSAGAILLVSACLWCGAAGAPVYVSAEYSTIALAINAAGCLLQFVQVMFIICIAVAHRGRG